MEGPATGSSNSSVRVVEMVLQPVRRPPPPRLVLAEKYGHGSTIDAEGDTLMRNETDLSPPPGDQGNPTPTPPQKGGPVTLPSETPVLRTPGPAFGDFPAPLPATTQETPVRKKGKEKATPNQCRTCRKSHNGKCRYLAHDWCDTCRKFHFGRCLPTASNPTGKTTKGKGIAEQAKRYAAKHQDAERTWENRTNLRKGYDKTGLKVETKEQDQQRQLRNPANNPTPHPVPPTIPPPSSPATAANAVPLAKTRSTKTGTETPKTTYRLIGTGRNCPAGTFTTAMGHYCRDRYNRVLQGTGIPVERVTVDPRLPRERKLTLITTRSEAETRTIISKNFTREGIFEKIFWDKEYQEVVILGYTVPGGVVTSTQTYGVSERLRELNPDLKMGPRYPVFLARINEPTKTAPLRVCLEPDVQQPSNIYIDLTSGVKEVGYKSYTRMSKHNQGRFQEGEWYNIVPNDINELKYEHRHYQRWSPPPHWNARPGLTIKCHACGKVHEGPCSQRTKPTEIRPKTGTCYDCGKKGHWAYECKGPRRPPLKSVQHDECFICGDKYWARNCPQKRRY